MSDGFIINYYLPQSQFKGLSGFGFISKEDIALQTDSKVQLGLQESFKTSRQISPYIILLINKKEKELCFFYYSFKNNYYRFEMYIRMKDPCYKDDIWGFDGIFCS